MQLYSQLQCCRATHIQSWRCCLGSQVGAGKVLATL